MKQYHEPIQVEVGDDGLPYSFRWRNRAWNVISVMDRWVLQTGWWRSDGTEKRDNKRRAVQRERCEGLQGVGGQLDVSRLPPIACIEHDLARTAAAANVKAFLPVFEWQHVSDERPWIHDAIGEQLQRPIPRGWPLAE